MKVPRNITTMILIALASIGLATPAAVATETTGVNTTASVPESIEVVLPPKASELERFAASELQRYLKHLFDVSARIVPKPSDSADVVFLLGVSTDPGVSSLSEDRLPELSDQGFLLRNTSRDGRPAMIIVGGSARATMWGVYELVERYGVRYLLHGDVFPPEGQEFHLPEIDRVFEPIFTARWFKTMGDFAIGMEGWGMADYRPLLDQLAKLKFNRIRIGGYPTAPYLDLQFKGVRRQSAYLFYGEHFPITSDMPGRHLFGKQTEYWHPDLPPSDAPYEELLAAGQRHMHDLIAYAKSRGIDSSSVSSITDFPKDLESVIPDAQPVRQFGLLTVAPGPSVRPDNPELVDIGGTVLRSILDQYPDAHSYGFPVTTENPSWVEMYEWAWEELDKRHDLESVVSLDAVLQRAAENTEHWGGGAERAVNAAKGGLAGLSFLLRLWNSPDVLPESRRPDARLVLYEPAEPLWPILPRVLPEGAELVVVVDYNSTRVLRRRHVLMELPTKEIPTTMVLSLHDDSVGVLPMLTTHALHELVGDMRKAGVTGVCTRQWLIGDHDPSMAYLSKASWDATTTPEAVLVDQIRAVCGPSAVDPMLETFRQVEAVTSAMEIHGMGLTFPTPIMMIRQWAAGPMPEELAEDREIYRRALDAIAKVPTPDRPEGKEYVRYWTGRLQFAVEYFDAIEAVKKAASMEKAAEDAKASGDQAAFRAKLAETIQLTEAAHDAAFHSIETFAGVARDKADRGAIATMAEYVCRQLKRKADSLRAAREET
jgi:hypothetical protein